jgi:ankyrin repeat protein
MFPLSIAVAHRNKEMVELLLEYGASVHYPVYYEYFPPIHQAAMTGTFSELSSVFTRSTMFVPVAFIPLSFLRIHVNRELLVYGLFAASGRQY